MKLCECGCLQPAPIAKQTITLLGHVKGEAIRFIRGHHMRGRTGEKSNGWKGGRRVTDGYIQQKHGGTSNQVNGYAYEHVTIAEEALGRRLPEKAEVHHVNGKRTDNRKDNLVICQDRAYHMLLHVRQRAFDATGNANSKKCPYCKQWGLDLTIAKSGRPYHKSCRSVYEAARVAKKKGGAQ